MFCVLPFSSPRENSLSLRLIPRDIHSSSYLYYLTSAPSRLTLRRDGGHLSSSFYLSSMLSFSHCPPTRFTFPLTSLLVSFQFHPSLQPSPSLSKFSPRIRLTNSSPISGHPRQARQGLPRRGGCKVPRGARGRAGGGRGEQPEGGRGRGCAAAADGDGVVGEFHCECLFCGFRSFLRA